MASGTSAKWRADCRTTWVSTSGGALKTLGTEAGYTSYPLFKESGMEPPMIGEGTKGQPSRPVMPLDLSVRPIIDEKYIIPKTIDFIRREAAAKNPFFVYVGYSQMHPPAAVNPAFDGKSAERGGRR
jgi:arylsulfatase